MVTKPVLIDVSYWPEKSFDNIEDMLLEYAPCYGRFEYQSQESTLHVVRFIQKESFTLKNKVNYHTFKYSFSRFWLPYKLNKFINSLQPDAIVVQGFYNPLQSLLLTFQTKAPIIIQDHGGGAPRRLTGLFQRLLSVRIKNYAFTSKVQAEEYFEKRLISRASRIYEIHEASSTMMRLEMTAARKELQLPNDETIFLWVGRLDIYKDPVTVLKGLKNVIMANKKIRFLMVYQEEPLIDKVRSVIETFGEAANRVTLIGKIEHNKLNVYYSSANYFVLGSHYEVAGISLYEAMSCGCVPLVTDIPSFRRITNNGSVGTLWKVGDSNSLEKAVQELILKDFANEQDKTLDYFKQELSFEALGRKHLEMVNDVIKNAVK
jgi:glycosyltransferase involved in cell wall biosynthesis